MLLLSLVLPLAHADQLVAGDALRVYYDSVGTWNDQSVGAGFQAKHDGAWVDWAYAGYPWQVLSVEYAIGDETYADYASSNTAAASFSVDAESDLSTEGYALSEYVYSGTGHRLTQAQAWAADGRVMRVSYAVEATRAALNDYRLTFVVDPDPDAATTGVYTTLNDTLDTDGDGAYDLVVSVSPSQGYTLGFGACDPDISELGHVADWSTTTDADVLLADDSDADADHAMGIRMTPAGGVGTDAGTELVFLVLVGDTVAEVEAAWAASASLCDGCDADDDGYTSALCGGDDCDDTSAAANPDGVETWYDGVDGDCDGADDYDQDADGSPYGTDCDDTDASAVPGGADAWYDGVDGDCDGASDYDADADGYDADTYGGADCDDTDPTVNPGATEVWYDDVDQDCDGNDADQDGDTYPFGEDCDDEDAAVYPGAGGVAGDGLDSDCDGSDDDVSGAIGEDPDGIVVNGDCGCDAGGGAGGVAGALVAAALLLRRRRG
jgi:uncharacterized protein (TIGR03382 family)